MDTPFGPARYNSGEPSRLGTQTCNCNCSLPDIENAQTSLAHRAFRALRAQSHEKVRRKSFRACRPRAAMKPKKNQKRVKKGGFQKGGFGGCSPGTKTGTRVRSPKPPFYETALLSPSDPFWGRQRVVSKRVVSADVPPERKPERGYVRQNRPFTKPPFISQ